MKVTSYQRYSDDCINECVKKAECKAKESVELLGMRELLEKHKLWDAVPSKMEDEIDTDDSDEEGEGDNDMIPDEVSRDIFSQDEMTENLSDMQEDVNILSKNELITPQAAVKFSKNLKASKNSSISVYSKIPASKDINEALDEPKSLKRFSAFVEIKSDMETPLYIRKSTAVWLFQEGERVSSDRLLRVKDKQPFRTTSKYDSDNTGMDNTVPFVATQLKTGDICIFKTTCLNWNIGKVESFCKLKG